MLLDECDKVVCN